MKCIFCTNQENILENQLAFARYDANPVNKGHMIVMTKRHIKDFFETTKEEKIALFEVIDQGKELLDKKYYPSGYNIGMNCGTSAGQTVMHLHIHLIPRYNGDIENPRGGVRGVIPHKMNY